MSLIVPACSSDGGGPSPATGSSESPSPLPEFVSGGTCPRAPESLALEEGAGCVSVAQGDVEGDGEAEALIVYALLKPDGYPDIWRMRIEGEGGPIDQRLLAGSPTSYPRAAGGADVDGDGRDEWFVKVLNLAGHGAWWGMLNVFVLSDRFQVVTYEGEPMPLYLGGISRTGEGIACRDNKLVQLRAEARNRQNTIWDVSARYFRIDGGRATLVRRDTDTLRLSDYNDPDLDPYYALNCRDLSYTV